MGDVGEVLAKYDDFVIASNDLSDAPGFTLTGLLHNEMHFLPPFLEHYRKLGVERFIFVDDRSTDGTLEFLCKQNDVMVVQSWRKYGDKLTMEDATRLGLTHQRLELLWRMLLLEKYTIGQWSAHLDADEFLDLPNGMLISDFVTQLIPNDGDAVWSTMIDMYPATLTDLEMMEKDETIDLGKSWYFDGEPHLRLRKGEAPKVVYPGCRARLLSKFRLNRKTKPFNEILRRILRLPPARYNAIRKPTLLRWSSGSRFNSAHTVNLSASVKFLLPLRHFKFNGPIHERINRASTTGGNTGGGAEYKDLKLLLAAMAQTDGDFRYSKSVQFMGFEDFQKTGNAVGFD